MDQQAKSTFIGIMAAVGSIAAICAVGYGIYYASQADERRKERLDSSMRKLECSTERLRLLNRGMDFAIGHPCRD